MLDRVPRAGAEFRLASVALFLIASLAGCAGGSRFPPACPNVVLLKPAADVMLYQPGGGHDLTELQLQGSITAASGTCRPGTTPGTVVATLSIGMDFLRGPVAPTRQANIPYFVAVARGDRILNKQVFTAQATFPPNKDRVAVTSGPIEVTLPVTPTRSGAAYTIWVGFQLTEAQLTGAGAQ